MSSPQILILDDDPLTGEQLRSLLKVLGFDSHLCFDASQGLALLSERTFDLVMCDYWLPSTRQEGAGISTELSSKFPQLQSRILFMTDNVLGEETQLFFKTSGHLQLTKPFRLTALKRALGSLLETAQANARPA